jgi:hypothetical protein
VFQLVLNWFYAPIIPEKGDININIHMAIPVVDVGDKISQHIIFPFHTTNKNTPLPASVTSLYATNRGKLLEINRE